MLPQEAYNARGLREAPDIEEQGNVIFTGVDPHGRGGVDPAHQFADTGVPYELLLFR